MSLQMLRQDSHHELARRGVLPHELTSSVSGSSEGGLGLGGGIILAPNCTVYFLRFSLWQQSCSMSVSVCVCEGVGVCACSALQSLLLVFSGPAPAPFRAHSGTMLCKYSSKLTAIKIRKKASCGTPKFIYPCSDFLFWVTFESFIPILQTSLKL